jgi:branched-chain amino acid transport system permease protein
MTAHDAMTTRDAAAAQLAGLSRWRPAEFVFWACVAASWFLFPAHHMLVSQIAVTALFAVSLDLVQGYAGIVSLGQAAFFGFGGYLAGIITVYGITDPLTGLALAALASALLGFATAFLVLRGTDLTRLMVTLGVNLVLYEIANEMRGLTGGSDGLQGVNIGKIFGVLDFDLAGHVAAGYSLIVFFLIFLVCRRVVNSPFGWSLRAIRQNPLRSSAIGIPVNARLVAIYTLGAAVAGIAGALLTQTTQFVSLDVLAFHRSADILLVLVIGGAGYLYGGPIGAVIFNLLQDRLSILTPQYWEFWLGFLLVLLVLAGRERMMRLPQLAVRRLRRAA